MNSSCLNSNTMGQVAQFFSLFLMLSVVKLASKSRSDFKKLNSLPSRFTHQNPCTRLSILAIHSVSLFTLLYVLKLEKAFTSQLIKPTFTNLCHLGEGNSDRFQYTKQCSHCPFMIKSLHWGL